MDCSSCISPKRSVPKAIGIPALWASCRDSIPCSREHRRSSQCSHQVAQVRDRGAVVLNRWRGWARKTCRRSFMSPTVRSSRKLPCSMHRTPHSTARLMARDVYACAVTYRFAASASSTAALISSIENCTLSRRSIGKAMPPPTMSLMWKAPRRSSSRVARRTWATPSQTLDKLGEQ